MTVREFERRALSLVSVYKADVFDILKKMFGLSDAQIINEGDCELDDRADDILDRLSNGEPSAYIIGEVEFNNIRIKVNSNVLIPRMETEELVMTLCDEIDFSDKSLLDLCSGSGCIGLSIAKKYPTCKVILADISDEALDVSKENASINGIENVSFVKSDYLDQIEDSFDYVVSNPPYIPCGKKADASFEPELALYSGEDGMDSYRTIFEGLPKVLNKDGRAFFEIEEGEKEGLTGILEKKEVYSFEFKKDLAGKTRFLYVWSKNSN